jgi:hypothetical protein
MGLDPGISRHLLHSGTEQPWVRGAGLRDEMFKSLGCVSCDQGVNIGGTLFQRHGIFHPPASPRPAVAAGVKELIHCPLISAELARALARCLEDQAMPV